MSEAQTRGVGGSYVIDENSGERKQVECTKPAAPAEAADTEATGAARKKVSRPQAPKE